MRTAVWALCSIWLQLPIIVWGHARLMQPPSRSSMWRLGFPTKKNFNDNALYCGGIQVPDYVRNHDFKKVIEAVVDVTTNHKGYFEFKICPNNNPKREASQHCLDKYPLQLAYGEGTQYYVEGKGKGEIKFGAYEMSDFLYT
ncbi:UNVERIFIED_CONTAM: hypothetical protein NCL1_35385 [Trichonephila clavipes]